MNDRILKRAGIILNMLAAVLFGLNYYITSDRITYINDQLHAFFDHSNDPTTFTAYLAVFIVNTSITFIGYRRYKMDIWSSKSSMLAFIAAILMLIPPIIKLFAAFAEISPKGVIGTVAIILFILGNAVQLWATYK